MAGLKRRRVISFASTKSKDSTTSNSWQKKMRCSSTSTVTPHEVLPIMFHPLKRNLQELVVICRLRLILKKMHQVQEKLNMKRLKDRCGNIMSQRISQAKKKWSSLYNSRQGIYWSRSNQKKTCMQKKRIMWACMEYWLALEMETTIMVLATIESNRSQQAP